jgi:predicted permease
MPEWLRRVRYLTGQRRAEQELAEELQLHREMAGRPIGNLLLAREDARAVWIAPWLDSLGQDIRHGIRSLRRSPALVVVCACSLGLGLGINALLYMAVTAVYGHQPSMSDPARIVGVEPGNGRQFSYADYSDLQRSEVFDGVAGFRTATMNLGSGESIRPAGIMNVTGNFFDVLGVTAAIGRTFTGAEAAAEREPRVVVVTHDFWRSRFGADPSAIGRVLTLSGQPFTLVGVLPEGYRSVSGWVAPQLYVPVSRLTLRSLDERGSPSLSVFARLSPDGTAEQAQAGVTTLGAALERAYPQQNEGMGRPASVYPVAEMQFRGTPFQFRMLAPLTRTIAALVLLIACFNVTGLLLARAAHHRREIAIRVAVGAGRARVMQTMLVEGFLIVIAGAAVGLPVAFALDNAPLPGSLAWIQSTMDFDTRLVPFGLAMVAGATLICALVPALRATRADVISDVHQGGETATPRLRLRQTIVVAQMALSLVLVMGAFLSIRSHQHVANVDVGFDLDNGIVVRLGLDATQYPGAARPAFADRVVEEIARVPGVQSAAVSNLVPLGGDSLVTTFHPAGRTDVPGSRPTTFSIGPGYLQTLGIGLVQGRDFTRSDVAGSLVVAIVNETYARTHFPGADAIGRRIATAGKPEAVIVGIVRDHRIDTIGETPKSVAYFPYAQDPSRIVIHARTVIEPDALLDAVQAAVGEVDPAVPVSVDTRRRAASFELGLRRAGTMALGAMGAVGLLLAMVGLYGVMAYVAASRRSEVGIRMVLGASGRRIRREMLQRTLALVGAGALAGAIAAAASMPALTTFLAGVSPFDPLAFAAAAIVLVLVGLAATYVPVRRASLVDPVNALRRQ